MPYVYLLLLGCFRVTDACSWSKNGFGTCGGSERERRRCTGGRRRAAEVSEHDSWALLPMLLPLLLISLRAGVLFWYIRPPVAV